MIVYADSRSFQTTSRGWVGQQQVFGVPFADSKTLAGSGMYGLGADQKGSGPRGLGSDPMVMKELEMAKMRGSGMYGLGFGSWIRSIGSKIVTGAKKLLPGAVAAAKSIGQEIIAEQGKKVVDKVVEKIDNPVAKKLLGTVGNAVVTRAQETAKPLPENQKAISDAIVKNSREFIRQQIAARKGSGATNAMNGQVSM